MWDTVFSIAAGLGGVCAFKAFVNRDGNAMPPDVAEGTPVTGWPRDERRKAFDYQIARHWRVYLAGGLMLFMFGAAGIVLQAVDASRASPPSQGELIEIIASDSDNTYDREEVTCMFELMNETGIDFSKTSRDEFLQKFTAALYQMTESELERFDECLDAQSRSQRGASISDAQLREFVIEMLVAEPSALIDRATAQCIVDVIEERDALRDVTNAHQVFTPELEEAMLDAEVACS